MAATKPAAIEKLRFETALAELEEIVREMESGEPPLEESLAAYKRGIGLLAHCRGLLSAAEEKVRILENEHLAVFDPDPAGMASRRAEPSSAGEP
ncbi:MAG: exodeoxyribonuclease VII small subunit [Betaproteobacteria bacterium]|nr:exodeoxyribonuclease VII small subunit [Betaproteobacteria bacterium]